MTTAFPLRSYSSTRSRHRWAAAGTFLFVLALFLVTYGIGVFFTQDVVVPTKQSEVTVTALSSGADLPVGSHSQLGSSLVVGLGPVPATVYGNWDEVSTGDIITLYRLDSAADPAVTNLTADSFTSSVVGAVKVGERWYLSTKWPDTIVDPFTLLDAYPGFVALLWAAFLFWIVFQCYRAVLRTYTPYGAWGPNIVRLVRSGLPTDPALRSNWSSLGELGGPLRPLPTATIGVVALALAALPLPVFMPLWDADQIPELVLLIGLLASILLVVLTAAWTMFAVDKRLPLYFGALHRLRVRCFLPSDWDLLPAWILLEPAGRRLQRQVRRRVLPAAYETAEVIAGESSLSLRQAVLLAEGASN